MFDQNQLIDETNIYIIIQFCSFLSGGHLTCVSKNPSTISGIYTDSELVYMGSRTKKM